MQNFKAKLSSIFDEMENDRSLGKKDLEDLRQFAIHSLDAVIKKYDGAFTPISENNMDYPEEQDEFDVSNLEESDSQEAAAPNMIALKNEDFLETLFAFSNDVLGLFNNLELARDRILETKQFLVEKYQLECNRVSQQNQQN